MLVNCQRSTLSLVFFIDKIDKQSMIIKNKQNNGKI